MAIGFVSDEIRRVFRLPPPGEFDTANPRPCVQAPEGLLAAGADPRSPEPHDLSL
jgi:hypothetical protein